MPNIKLQRVLYIQYLVLFCQVLVQAFIDLGNEVNTIKPSFAKKLGLHIIKTEVGTQKIDGSRLKTFEMIITFFSIDNTI